MDILAKHIIGWCFLLLFGHNASHIFVVSQRNVSPPGLFYGSHPSCGIPKFGSHNCSNRPPTAASGMASLSFSRPPHRQPAVSVCWGSGLGCASWSRVGSLGVQVWAAETNDLLPSFWVRKQKPRNSTTSHWVISTFSAALSPSFVSLGPLDFHAV